MGGDRMKNIIFSTVLAVGLGGFLQGCGLALFSTAGIPATEYMVRQDSKSNPDVAIPVTAGLVAAHGGITYLLLGACWPCAVAYLGFSGVYTVVRVGATE